MEEAVINTANYGTVPVLAVALLLDEFLIEDDEVPKLDADALVCKCAAGVPRLLVDLLYLALAQTRSPGSESGPSTLSH